VDGAPTDQTKTKSINLRIQVRIEARSGGRDHAYRLLGVGVGLLFRHRANRTGGWLASGNWAAGRELNRRDETIRLLLLRWKNEETEGARRRAI